MSQDQVRTARDGGIDLSRYCGGGPPNFRSAAPGSACWIVVRGGKVYLYRSQGRSVVRAIQCAVGATPDGWWGPRTNQGLRYVLNQRGWDADMHGVEDGSINTYAFEAALAIVFGTPHPNEDEPAEDTILVPGTVLPAWMRPPPSDGEYRDLFWKAEMPMGVAMPPARSNPSFGRGPRCSSGASRSGGVYTAPRETVVAAPAGLLSGEQLAVPAEPVAPSVSVTFGADAPSLSRASIVGGCAVALGVVLLLLSGDE